MKQTVWQNVFIQTPYSKLKTTFLYLPAVDSTSVFLRCFDQSAVSHFSNGLSKYSRTWLHVHHPTTTQPRFVTISVFRWNICSLSKCL